MLNTPRYQRERVPQEIVDAIRAEYVPRRVPLKLLAHKHGLCISTVWNIINRYRWHK